MAFDLSKAIVKKAVAAKTTKQATTKKPFVTQFIKEPFIRKVNNIVDGQKKVPSDQDAARAAYKVDPYLTIMALSKAGYGRTDIESLLGFSKGSTVFATYFARCKARFQEELLSELLAPVRDMIVETQTGDGDTEKIDLTKKLRTAITEAVFKHKSSVSVSVKRGRNGLSVETPITEILEKTPDEIRKIADTAIHRFSAIFRTRETLEKGATAPALPALASIVKQAQ